MKTKSFCSQLLALLAVMMLCRPGKLAARDYPDGFLSPAELPNGVLLCPPPPVRGDSTFAADAVFYEWGKARRTADVAERFRKAEEGEIYENFSSAFGLHISEQETPAIENLCLRVTTDMWKLKNTLKTHFHRDRPFQDYGEPSILPEADAAEPRGKSYPSGHSAMGFLNAMVLAQVAPDSLSALLARAQQFAWDRVVAGVHYKSDIDAAWVLANALFVALQQNADYRQSLVKAREEYAARRKSVL